MTEKVTKISEVVSTTQSEDDEFLSLQEIVDSQDVVYDMVVVPEWGNKKVRIGSLSAEDIVEWTDANSGAARKTAGGRIFIKSLVDKDGNRIGDIKMLGALLKKNSAAIGTVLEAILKLNKLEIKQEAVKNVSSGASDAASHTVSQAS